jgi:hypothetical protein
MNQPVLLVTGDDQRVVRTLREDLGRRFGQDFLIAG